MTNTISRPATLAATAIAALLLLAGQAAAGPDARRTHLVSGSEAGGIFSGSLVGTMPDTPGAFESFFATYRLTPGGVFTWRAPSEFDGCVDGRCGKLYLDSAFHYRFKPGTVLYDFSPGAPLYQPGTTGDPAMWISGGSINVIRRGEGGLDGATGILLVRETEFLSAHTYWGVVRF